MAVLTPSLPSRLKPGLVDWEGSWAGSKVASRLGVAGPARYRTLPPAVTSVCTHHGRDTRRYIMYIPGCSTQSDSPLPTWYLLIVSHPLSSSPPRLTSPIRFARLPLHPASCQPHCPVQTDLSRPNIASWAKPWQASHQLRSPVPPRPVTVISPVNRVDEHPSSISPPSPSP